MPRSPKDWLGAIAAVLIVLVLLPVLILALLLSPIRYHWEYRRANLLRREFDVRWAAHGKRGLLVYSNSLHWKEYVEQHWLPVLGATVVVLNWSDQTTWKTEAQFEARLFRHFAGPREFNPIAIVFVQPPTGFKKFFSGAWQRRDWLSLVFPGPVDVKVIRFWKAFRDFKHGRDRALRTAEGELFAALNVQPPGSHAAA